MTAFFIITIIVLVVYWLFFKNGNDSTPAISQRNPAKAVESVEIIEEPKEQIFIDENGLKYRNVSRIKEIPRKTYLHGLFIGKYWGEIDVIKEEEYERFKFYDFNIYEAEVKTKLSNKNCFCITSIKTVCDGFHTESEGKFQFEADSNFPKTKLPQTIPCSISIKGNTAEYSVVLHEPQLRDIKLFLKVLLQMINV